MGFSVPGQPQNTAPRSAPVATSRAGGYAAPTTRQQEAALATVAPSEPVKYEAGGEEIELSPELIKAYLVNGDADKVTDQEVMMYLNLCRFNHLKGSGIQGHHLDVAVSGSHDDALHWAGYGTHKVWILKGE